MSNSAFSFISQTNTLIEDDGVCNITQNITQSLPSHQIFDWLDVDNALCIKAGDIIWLNPSSGKYEAASAASLDSCQAIGVVEQTAGCDANRAKVVYQGRIDFPNDYSTRVGATYYLADSLEVNEKGSTIIRNGSLTRGTCCKPIYIGTGGSSAVVINSLYCEDVPVPETGPKLDVSFVCGGTGPTFTVTNIGDGPTTASVDWEVYSASVVIDSGSIANPFGAGDSLNFPYVGTNENYQFVLGDPSDPLTYDTATSNCSFATDVIRARVLVGPEAGGGIFPSAITYFDSDTYVGGGLQTVPFTGATFGIDSTPVWIQLENSAQYDPEAPNPNNTITARFDGPSGQYNLDLTYDAVNDWWFRDGTPGLANRLVSITIVT